MDDFLETICVRILRRCNLSCMHCWAGSSPLSSDILDVDRILKFVDEIRPLGLKHVSLSGGEPLLYKGLYELLDKLLARGLYLTLTTNGSFGNDINSKLTPIFKYKNSRLRLRVSIDGTKKMHEFIRGKQTFDKTIKSIKKIKAEMGWVGVNTVLVFNSEIEAKDLCRTLFGLNIDHWGLMTLLSKGSNTGHQESVVAIKNRVLAIKAVALACGLNDKLSVWDYCERDRGHLLVDADGRVLIPGRNEERDIVIGRYDECLKTSISKAIIEDLSDNPIAFYKWMPW